ncbi:hypothetical protein MTF65_04295 [Streptomyces sp. APSN-46.1]|uniref:hypothetical protein n=1 Tax=Streptomyces sp. APSN-46.1 TaxID=2929049 RepID=UPI001FB4FB6C|nr:hypothetical protein [Streptomyces sp. APSN-46.1]MCJ1676582.1 hypothetical protein [Streptomyces sp. APSN-46.1]
MTQISEDTSLPQPFDAAFARVQHVISGGVLTLIDHPDQLSDLRARLARPADQLRWNSTFRFRALRELPVTTRP